MLGKKKKNGTRKKNLINFNLPCVTGKEQEFIHEAFKSSRLSGGGYFTTLCEKWIEEKIKAEKAILTSSCTHALEIAAMLIETQAGDEVIAPSYTFVSTVNPFVLRGARVRFVDIRPDTLNINEDLVEAAITPKTKAIIVVHYGGVPVNMDKIKNIAQDNDIYVIEDAAQAFLSTYKERYLGIFGDLATFSFHDTKNFTSGGEGGCLTINDKKLIDRAVVLRDKGTNRYNYLSGKISKYEWIDVGSSYLMSELQAAYLWAQLLHSVAISEKRAILWNRYKCSLGGLLKDNNVRVHDFPGHNSHLFAIIFQSLHARSAFVKFLNRKSVQANSHYVPLHSSPAGLRHGDFVGDDMHTTVVSQSLVRLPLYFNLSYDDQETIISEIFNYFQR